MANGDKRGRHQRTIILILSGVVVLLLSIIAGGIYYIDTYVWRPVPSTHAASSYDDSMRRNVVAVADVVFLGEVEASVSEIGLPLSGPGNEEVPMAQYRVRVIQTLKGEDLLEPTVIVNSIHHDQSHQGSIGTGSRYIFAATKNETYDTDGNPIGHDWFRVAAAGRDYVEVPSAAEEAPLVASFKSAIATQPSREEVLGTHAR